MISGEFLNTAVHPFKRQLLRAGALGLLLAAQTGLALEGTYVPDSEFPANVCKIEFYRSDQDFRNPATCSATVIAENRVLTAAHCAASLKDTPVARVRCGTAASMPMPSFGAGLVVKGHARPKWYAEKTKMHDLAVFEVDGKFQATPVTLARDGTQIEELLKDPAKCRIFGYGRDNNGRTGTAHGVVLGYLKDQKEVPPYSIAAGPDHATPGDSGGAVLCPGDPSASYWVQIAVTTSQAKKGKLSFHEMLIGPHLKWLEAIAKEPQIGWGEVN